MTFSIVARDPQSKRVGIAITTSSIAVGSRCPWVRSGVGAVATQNITDPMLGSRLLDLLEQGMTADRALERITSNEPNIEYRQLTLVDISGNVSHFSGQHILGINAVAAAENCVAAGNLLANTSVPQAIVTHFVNRQKDLHLAQVLIESLKAGIAAGGEQGSVHSASVMVAHEQPWPEVDLRIDWTDDDPIEALYRLWQAYAPQSQDYITRAVSPQAAPSYGVPGDE